MKHTRTFRRTHAQNETINLSSTKNEAVVRWNFRHTVIRRLWEKVAHLPATEKKKPKIKKYPKKVIKPKLIPQQI